MVSTLSISIFAVRSEQRMPVASSKPAQHTWRLKSATRCFVGPPAGAARSAVRLATRERAHWRGHADVNSRTSEHVAVQQHSEDPDRRLGDVPAEDVILTIHGCACPLPSVASVKCGLRSESLWKKTTADAGSIPAASING